MKRQGETTKEAIIEAAIVLFHSKGYEGTTIRDIASRAKVNPANISYYFQGKLGLLEACMVYFFERYLACLEEEVEHIEKDPPHECLLRAIRNILEFQSKHFYLSRLVWREVSIDSQVSREVMSTYLMKERYFLKTFIQASFKNHHNSLLFVSMAVIQLKGMLIMPYTNIQYVQEVWNLSPQETYFVDRYYEMLEEWLASFLNKQPKPHRFEAANF